MQLKSGSPQVRGESAIVEERNSPGSEYKSEVVSQESG